MVFKKIFANLFNETKNSYAFFGGKDSQFFMQFRPDTNLLCHCHFVDLSPLPPFAQSWIPPFLLPST